MPLGTSEEARRAKNVVMQRLDALEKRVADLEKINGLRATKWRPGATVNERLDDITKAAANMQNSPAKGTAKKL